MPLTSIKLDVTDSADQEYIRHKLEDAVYMALDISLADIADLIWSDSKINSFVAEEFTIKVTT